VATNEATCIWLTGRAGAGKTTIARAVVDELHSRGRAAVVIDEADARAHLSAADPADGVTWLAGLLVPNGVVVVVAVDAPDRAARDRAREELPGFVEVYVDGGGGPDDAYEEPFAAELRVPTHDRDVAASVAQLMSWLEDSGVAPPPDSSGARR
jgi:adenylylsulfate kinase-like enzyme